MLTPREIRSTDFERIVRGYNPEDVDAFLTQIADQMEQLEADKDAAEKKMMVLAEKVDEMRADEGTLRSVLVTAEKMKEQILQQAQESAAATTADAQQKADALLADAQQRSTELVTGAQDKYDEIIGSITAQAAKETATLKMLKDEVSSFKNNIMSIYKRHLEVLSELPDAEPQKDEPEKAEPQPETAAAPAQDEPVLTVPTEFEATTEIKMPPLEDAAPAAEETPAETYSFGKYAPAAAAAAPELKEVKKTESAFSSFIDEDEDVKGKFGKLDFGDSFTFGNE